LRSTVTNLVIFLELVELVHKVKMTLFILILVMSALLYKINNYGLPSGFLNWILPNRQSENNATAESELGVNGLSDPNGMPRYVAAPSVPPCFHSGVPY
jgi:hypothetical protein